MGFNLNEYEEVKDRIPRFWAKHPDGAIVSELLARSDTDYIVLSKLINAAGQVIATGLAQETVGSSNVNKTSALENCETSAIGRALANAGFSAGKERPSREEMRKADRAEGGSSSRPETSAAAPRPASAPPARSTSSTRLASDKQRKFIERLVDKTGMIPQTWPLAEDLSAAEASKLIDWLNEQPVEPPAERVKTLRKQFNAEFAEGEEPF